MVREIVDHRDATDLAAHFHSPLHAGECAQPFAHAVPIRLYCFRRGDHRQDVSYVERAGKRCVDHSPFLVGSERVEPGAALAELDLAGVPVRLAGRRLGLVSIGKRLHRRERLGRQLAHDRRIPARDQDSVLRNEVDEARERELVRLLVAIDVGVIELDVVDDRRVRQVVPHLRTLVEVRGVVLVSLNDEIMRARKSIGRPEVLSDSADQEARIEPRRLEHPRQERCGRRLPVRARHRHRVMTPDELFFYGSGGRGVAKLLDQHRFQLRVPPRDRVADDDDVRLRRKILRLVPLAVGDPHLLEPRRHWRVYVLIRAGDRVTRGLQQPRQRSHGSTTNSNQVIVKRIPASLAGVSRHSASSSFDWSSLYWNL